MGIACLCCIHNFYRNVNAQVATADNFRETTAVCRLFVVIVLESSSRYAISNKIVPVTRPFSLFTCRSPLSL